MTSMKWPTAPGRWQLSQDNPITGFEYPVIFKRTKKILMFLPAEMVLWLYAKTDANSVSRQLYMTL